MCVWIEKSTTTKRISRLAPKGCDLYTQITKRQWANFNVNHQKSCVQNEMTINVYMYLYITYLQFSFFFFTILRKRYYEKNSWKENKNKIEAATK